MPRANRSKRRFSAKKARRLTTRRRARPGCNHDTTGEYDCTKRPCILCLGPWARNSAGVEAEFRRLKRSVERVKPLDQRHSRPMWVALDKKNRMQATWYRGCVTTWAVWRRTIRGLGWRPVLVRVVFPW